MTTSSINSSSLAPATHTQVHIPVAVRPGQLQFHLPLPTYVMPHVQYRHPFNASLSYAQPNFLSSAYPVIAAQNQLPIRFPNSSLPVPAHTISPAPTLASVILHPNPPAAVLPPPPPPPPGPTLQVAPPSSRKRKEICWPDIHLSQEGKNKCTEATAILNDISNRPDFLEMKSPGSYRFPMSIFLWFSQIDNIEALFMFDANIEFFKTFAQSHDDILQEARNPDHRLEMLKKQVDKLVKNPNAVIFFDCFLPRLSKPQAKSQDAAIKKKIEIAADEFFKLKDSLNQSAKNPKTGASE